MNLKVSVDFSDGGAGAQAAHDCDQVSGGDLALALLVVQREALLELCEWENKTNGERFPVRSQHVPVLQGRFLCNQLNGRND